MVLAALYCNKRMTCFLTLKEPGFLDPSHSRGGGGGFRPPKISETDWRSIKCVVLVDSYDPPESIGTKKVQTYLVWRHSDVISDVMSKTRKSPKIAKIMVVRYFFKQKLHFLAMMCVKVCLHMFLLPINQINKIKHSESVSWNQKKYKKHDLCVISIENQFLVSFSLDQALSIFFLNGLKSSARLEGKKSWSFSAKN